MRAAYAVQSSTRSTGINQPWKDNKLTCKRASQFQTFCKYGTKLSVPPLSLISWEQTQLWWGIKRVCRELGLFRNQNRLAKVPNYLWSWLENCFHCEQAPSSGFLQESFIKRLELINHQTSRCSRLKEDCGGSWELQAGTGMPYRQRGS